MTRLVMFLPSYLVNNSLQFEGSLQDDADLQFEGSLQDDADNTNLPQPVCLFRAGRVTDKL